MEANAAATELSPRERPTKFFHAAGFPSAKRCWVGFACLSHLAKGLELDRGAWEATFSTGPFKPQNYLIFEWVRTLGSLRKKHEKEHVSQNTPVDSLWDIVPYAQSLADACRVQCYVFGGGDRHRMLMPRLNSR
eukprot:1157436-Pelagomonas_calceolata.AAC.1